MPSVSGAVSLPSPLVPELDELCGKSIGTADPAFADDLGRLADYTKNPNAHVAAKAKSRLNDVMSAVLYEERSASPEFASQYLGVLLKVSSAISDPEVLKLLDFRMQGCAEHLLRPLAEGGEAEALETSNILPQSSQEMLLTMAAHQSGPCKFILQRLTTFATDSTRPPAVIAASFSALCALSDGVDSSSPNSTEIMSSCFQTIQQYLAYSARHDDAFATQVAALVSDRCGAVEDWDHFHASSYSEELVRASFDEKLYPEVQVRAQRELCKVLEAGGYADFAIATNTLARIALGEDSSLSALASQTLFNQVLLNASSSYMKQAVAAVGKIIAEPSHPSAVLATITLTTLLASNTDMAVQQAIFTALAPAIDGYGSHPGHVFVSEALTNTAMKDLDLAPLLLKSLTKLIATNPRCPLAVAGWKFLKGADEVSDSPHLYVSEKSNLLKEVLSSATHPNAAEAFRMLSDLVYNHRITTARACMFSLAANSSHPYSGQASKIALKLLKHGWFIEQAQESLCSILSGDNAANSRDFGKWVPNYLNDAPKMKVIAPAAAKILCNPEHPYYRKTRDNFLAYLNDPQGKSSAEWLAPAMPAIKSVALDPDAPLRQVMRGKLFDCLTQRRSDSLAALAAKSCADVILTSAAEYLALPDTDFYQVSVGTVRSFVRETFEALVKEGARVETIEEVFTAALIGLQPAIRDRSHATHAELCELLTSVPYYKSHLGQVARDVLKDFVKDPRHPLFALSFRAMKDAATFRVVEPSGAIEGVNEEGEVLLAQLPKMQAFLLSATPEEQRAILPVLLEQFERHYGPQQGWVSHVFNLAVNVLDALKEKSDDSLLENINLVKQAVQERCTSSRVWDSFSEAEQTRILNLLK